MELRPDADPDDLTPRTPSRWERWMLPPHIGWPLLVVGLLGMSLSFATHTVMEAIGDGGAQIVDESAERSTPARWLLAGADRLPDETSGLTPLELTLTDAAGRPIEGATGVIRLGESIRIPFASTDEPGRYRALVPTGHADSAARVEAVRGPERYSARLPL